MGLSYQNFNNMINNNTKAIKFDNLKALCDILECTPNDLFEEYYECNLFNHKQNLFSGKGNPYPGIGSGPVVVARVNVEYHCKTDCGISYSSRVGYPLFHKQCKEGGGEER